MNSDKLQIIMYTVAYQSNDGSLKVIDSWSVDERGRSRCVGSLEDAIMLTADSNAFLTQKCRHYVCEVITYDAGTDSVHEMIPRRMPWDAPDSAIYYDPRPEYLRTLIESSGLSQNLAAKKIGISERSLRYYLSDRKADYPVQVALEDLSNCA